MMRYGSSKRARNGCVGQFQLVDRAGRADNGKLLKDKIEYILGLLRVAAFARKQPS